MCCFSGIYQKRISPLTVVACGTFCTLLGWLLWDSWVGQEEAAVNESDWADESYQRPDDYPSSFATSPAVSRRPSRDEHLGLGLMGFSQGNTPNQTPLQSSPNSRTGSLAHRSQPSNGSVRSGKLSPIPEPLQTPPIHPDMAADKVSYDTLAPPTSLDETMTSNGSGPPSQRHDSTTSTSTSAESAFTSLNLDHSLSLSQLSPRAQQRLATFKSALLIYSALLGLSPILKSLTQSTADDSIWAISFWLMCINVFFFDYSSGPPLRSSKENIGHNIDPNPSLGTSSGAPPNPNAPGHAVGVVSGKTSSSAPYFPASLSTNAALMASTVLASRLESTTFVFSLTLFSIEVFGLFPVFRRYLRHVSWRGHLTITWALVMGAGSGVALILSFKSPLSRAVLGALSGTVLAALAMGGASWWLIGLQRFKNEIHGPWDPARPVLRRRTIWD